LEVTELPELTNFEFRIFEFTNSQLTLQIDSLKFESLMVLTADEHSNTACPRPACETENQKSENRKSKSNEINSASHPLTLTHSLTLSLTERALARLLPPACLPACLSLWLVLSE